MKKYTILPKTNDWNDIPAASIDTQLWTDEIDIIAFAQICYDSNALYVRLTAKEKNIRALETGPIGMPCKDSCLEFFFSPIDSDNRYFNIEFNPEKCIFLGIGTSRHDSIRLLPDTNTVFKPSSTRTNDGWEITYQIPFSFIKLFFKDFVVAPGIKMRGNFYKCGDLTLKEHYFSWNPVELPSPDFHCPQYFGELIFG